MVRLVESSSGVGRRGGVNLAEVVLVQPPTTPPLSVVMWWSALSTVKANQMDQAFI